MIISDKKPRKKHGGLTCDPRGAEALDKLFRSSQERFVSDLIKLKEERSVSDTQLSKLFFAIGLTLSLFFIILAFEWKTYEPMEIVDLGTIDNDFSEIIEIPPTEQLPPPPPKTIVTPLIREVSNDQIIQEIEVEIDLEVSEDMIIPEVTNYDFNAEIPVEKPDEIFDIVESLPQPVGGFSEFYEYVKNNLKYPPRASRLDLSGRVFVQFVVEKDGSITDVKVLKGFYEDCDKEAVRVIENSPKWVPGTQRGRPVRVYQRLPIMFVLKKN